MNRDYKYLIRTKTYFSEADQLIAKLKEKVNAAPYEAGLDLRIQIEKVKIKRVELQLKMDRAWRDTEKTWGLFKLEFERDNRLLVQNYRKIISTIKIGDIHPRSKAPKALQVDILPSLPIREQ